jgi:poly-gamma-glutamate synthase PgsB/CapB
MLRAAIVALVTLFWGRLYAEAKQARLSRAQLAHVIHVNGTRGKTTVTRLIAAGLRAGGLRVFCKTTGTVPMVIDTDNIERPIVRRGRSNIKEQLKVMREAAKQSADVLVVECMAVNPVLQFVAQHRMLCADIGVITNVRLDHTDVMGKTLPEICNSLSQTIPQEGVLFTADADFYDQLRENAKPLKTEVHLARDDGSLPDFDFPENIALALAVCGHLGVPRDIALEGMRTFHRDPYALSLHRVGAGLFINGMSINDPQSTMMVYKELSEKLDLTGRRLILLINNRPDRAERTQDMIGLALALEPDEIRVLGASRRYMRRKLLRKMASPPPIRLLPDATAAHPSSLGPNEVMFAVGNIADGGKKLMEIVEREGVRLV